MSPFPSAVVLSEVSYVVDKISVICHCCMPEKGKMIQCSCHEKFSPGAKFHPRINYRNSHPAKNYPCLLFFILPHPFVSAPLATCQLD